MRDGVIIGLHGLPRVGKDTAADVLVSKCGFHRIAFADKLKEELSQAYAVRRETFEQNKFMLRHELALNRCHNQEFVDYCMKFDDIREELKIARLSDVMTRPRSSRWTMRHWGTEYRRSQDDNYWLKKVQDKIDLLPIRTNIVITDVRFKNEAELVLSYGHSGIVQIVRTTSNGRPIIRLPRKHLSDYVLPDNYLAAKLFNEGGLDEFKNNVEILFTKLLTS